jgi:hypothetical protein
MCLHFRDQSPDAKVMFRRAGVVAACSAAFAGAYSLCNSHGHATLGKVLIGIQVSLLLYAICLLFAAKRLNA